MIGALILFLRLQAPAAVPPAQAPAAQAAPLPAFEVASLKLNTSNDQMNASVVSGQIIAHALPLQRLVQEAWNVRPEQIVGAPGWMATDRYDLAAKAGHDTSIEEVRQMLQVLLIERFQMTVHNDQKELAAFVLTADKEGARLGAAKDETPEVMAQEGCQARPVDPATGERGVSCTLSMDRLALSLPLLAPGYFNHTTVNQTGIPGVFQFDLRFVPAGQQASIPGPSLFDALARIGIHVEDRKVMLPTLVIDQIERVPTGN